MVRDIRGAAERSLDQVVQFTSRRMAARNSALESIEAFQQPPQNVPKSGLSMQIPRRNEIPPATITFDQGLLKVGDTVSGAIATLMAADTPAKRVAAESRLRRILQNDQTVDTRDIVLAKNSLSERLAELHNGEGPDIPDQKTFDVYMMVLRQLDNIIERRTLDLNRG